MKKTRFDILTECIDRFKEKYSEMLNHEGTDCSEIAEYLNDFLYNNYSIESKFLYIKEKNKRLFNIYEYGNIEEVFYHYVLVVGRKVIDMRDLAFFYTIGTYKERLNYLNPNIELLYTIKNKV